MRRTMSFLVMLLLCQDVVDRACVMTMGRKVIRIGSNDTVGLHPGPVRCYFPRRRCFFRFNFSPRTRANWASDIVSLATRLA